MIRSRHTRILLCAALTIWLATALSYAQSTDPEEGESVLRKLAVLEEKIDRLEHLIVQLLARAPGEDATVEPMSAQSPAMEPYPEVRVNLVSRSSREWESLARGWEFRNATFQHGRDEYGFFLVELRRTGPPVAGAMFTITLYNAEGGIAGTAGATVLTMQRGEVKTAEFLVDIEALSRSTSYRLQSDMEF